MFEVMSYLLSLVIGVIFGAWQRQKAVKAAQNQAAELEQRLQLEQHAHLRQVQQIQSALTQNQAERARALNNEALSRRDYFQ